MTKKKKPLIGAHVSSSGGILKIPNRAKEIGAECVQIFAGSPKRYDVKVPEKENINEYKKELEKNGISLVYVHASYLLNLASKESELKRKSIESLKNALYFSSVIGARGVVYHPGSPKGENKEEAIYREINSLEEVISNTPKSSTVFIENTAGKKKIGTTQEEIGFIVRKINSPRIKICIDTAHSFEAGLIEDFEKSNILSWLEDWKKEINLDDIGLLHINDSLTKFNSQHDRHANIGSGEIGLKGFKNLMGIDELIDVPWIIEVPGFENGGPDKKNINILKKMREEKSNFA